MIGATNIHGMIRGKKSNNQRDDAANDAKAADEIIARLASWNRKWAGRVCKLTFQMDCG